MIANQPIVRTSMMAAVVVLLGASLFIGTMSRTSLDPEPKVQRRIGFETCELPREWLWARKTHDLDDMFRRP